MLQEWIKEINRQREWDKKDTLVFIDFSKAFNSIPHDKLKEVIEKRIPNNEVKNLLYQYLDNSRVNIYGKQYKADYGVP